MKHSRNSLLVTCLLQALLLTLAGCGGDSLKVTDKVKTGRLMVTVQFNMGDEVIALLPEEFDQVAQAHGMTKNPTGYSQVVPAAQQELIVDGFAVTTDDEGYFALPTGSSDPLVVNVKAGSEFLPTELGPHATATTGEPVQLFELRVVHSSCCQEGVKNQHNPHGDSRCLDYNGWFSNRQNLPPWHPQAWVNFYGSDCHRALAWCVLDHRHPGGCMARHNGCSRFIGHSQEVHWHNVW